jgi:gas vesicle protein
MAHKSGRSTFLLIGGIIGAGIALLYAPQSGRETRRDIHRFGKAAKDRSQRFLIHVGRKTDRLAHDISGKVVRQMDRGQKVAHGVKSAFAAGMDRIQKSASA